jgi:SagB-type dehydrogenase family enzyme
MILNLNRVYLCGVYMKQLLFMLFTLVLLINQGCFLPAARTEDTAMTQQPATNTIRLPAPAHRSNVSLEETLQNRRSVRSYSDVPLSLSEVSQLLWAAQGITESWGGRTAPSAGGLYPLEVYFLAGNVTGLTPGEYKYIPQGHRIELVKEGDPRSGLAAAALDQAWVKEGSIVISIIAVYARTTQKYGDRGIRYVNMEAGHAAQNICLQATALDLGAVTVGAFNDDRVRNVLSLPEGEMPVYLIPIGKIP